MSDASVRRLVEGMQQLKRAIDNQSAASLNAQMAVKVGASWPVIRLPGAVGGTRVALVVAANKRP